MEKKKLNIDIKKVVKTALQRKWLFVKVWVITFVLSCIWILPQPRYYTSEVSIAPESTDMKDAGNLASLASSFGVSLGNGSGDAIYPQLYPDLFASTQFMVSLMDIQVQTMEGDVNTDYFTYLKDYQQKNILFEPIRLGVNWVKSFFEKGEPSIPGKDGQRFDPFHLSRSDNDIITKALPVPTAAPPMWSPSPSPIRTPWFVLCWPTASRSTCRCISPTIAPRSHASITSTIRS